MKQVGKVDYFDGAKRKVLFFVEDEENVEEEGFYKVETDSKIFYIFVTNLSEQPLDKEMRSRYSRNDFVYDLEERFLLYAQATILMEHRKKTDKDIIGYKTIPRHDNKVYTLDKEDFDILNLPHLDFAHVRSGSKQLETTAGFKPDAYKTHWLLSGWTNSGKTNASKILLGVTIKGDGNSSYAGGIVIDPHGEYYKDLKVLNSGGVPRIIHLTLDPDHSDDYERPLKIPLNLLTPANLLEVADFNPETQVPFMWRCRDYFKKSGKSGNWIEMIVNADYKILKELGEDYAGPAGQKVMDAVKRRLSYLIRDDRKIWSSEYTSIVDDMIRDITNGAWYVIDVSSISNNATKLITSLLSFKLFDTYKKTAIEDRAKWSKFKPAGILVEEAHNYLSPEESSKGNIIAKIAKEGRKFNVFTIIVEQDPSGIDDRILKQVHNKITLQLIPIDAEAITRTTPYIKELENKIPYYQTGEGVFVSTGSFNFALPVKFPRVSDWIIDNTKVCKKCGKGRALKEGELCIDCVRKEKARDIEALMS